MSDSLIDFDGYMSMFTLKNLVKYIIEGVAIAVAAFLIPNRNSSLKEVAIIGLVAALTFFVLDTFSPATGDHSRQGAGLGIGYNLIASPPVGLPLKNVRFDF